MDARGLKLLLNVFQHQVQEEILKDALPQK